jgi:hypothetical protein
LEVDFGFGSFFSWTPRILDNLLSSDLYLFHDTCNTMICLGLAPCLAPVLYSRLWVVILSSSVEGSISVFRLQRLENFLPLFWGPPPSESMLWICLAVLSKLIVLSLLLLYLVGLAASFSLGTFHCCSSLRKCSTSDLLNLWKLSYNSSNVLGSS